MAPQHTKENHTIWQKIERETAHGEWRYLLDRKIDKKSVALKNFLLLVTPIFINQS